MGYIQSAATAVSLSDPVRSRALEIVPGGTATRIFVVTICSMLLIKERLYIEAEIVEHQLWQTVSLTCCSTHGVDRQYVLTTSAPQRLYSRVPL